MAPFEPLKNWKDPDEGVSGCVEHWNNFTPSDKNVITSSILLLFLLVGYCVSCMLWADSRFGISFTVCFLSYLLNLAYYRCYKSKMEILLGELIAGWCGLVLGIAYWSVYNSEVVGPVAFSCVFLLILGFLAYKSFRHDLEIRIKVSLTVKILLLIVFILITLGLHR